MPVDSMFAIVADGQDIQQLFQIGPMVLVASPSDGGNRLAGDFSFGVGVGVIAEKGDRGGVIVQFVQADVELSHHGCDLLSPAKLRRILGVNASGGLELS